MEDDKLVPNQETKLEQLERERDSLYKFIAREEQAIERAKKNIHWDKKRLKVVLAQLSELKETPLQTLEKIVKQ